MYAQQRHTDLLSSNPYWDAVLGEYAKLHRTCMQNVGNDIVAYILSKNSSSGCKFVIGDNEKGTGLGNKVLSAVSSLVYAVLTQRVLLIPESTSIPGIMCEPFEGSSWKVITDGVVTPAKHHPAAWNHVRDVYKAVDATKRGWKNVSSIYAARAIEDWECQPEKRFFCETEQEFYTQVTWVYFSECLYFLPKLFAVPRFRQVLEALFPLRMALPHLLRSTMLPSDPVWLRVKQVNNVYLKHADHRIGIQPRYFSGKKEFQQLHVLFNAAIAKCVVDNGLLPNTSLTSNITMNVGPESGKQVDGLSQGTSSESPRGEVFSVFITSLYLDLRDHLTEIYVRNPAPTGDAVGIIQLTHEGQQQFGVEVDTQALTEVIALSLSDDLLVTPQSTFGALAQGYGALTPWFIDIRGDTDTGCVRGQTVDACYQIPNDKHYVCPHDPDLDGKTIADVVPYIKDCHLIEKPFTPVHGAGLGFQLITSSRKESSD